jgi:hypothetical protein
MMARLQNPNIAHPCRRGSTGHATGLPNSATERSNQRQSMLKAKILIPGDTGQELPTIKSIIMAVLNPVKSTAQPSNPHSSNKPKRRT